MEVPEPKPFSSNVITTQSRLSKWIFQRGPGFKLSSFKDSTRSVTGAFKAARQPSRHLEPTRAHRLRALAYCSPLYSPQVETLLEQLDTKFDDMSSQIVDRSTFFPLLWPFFLLRDFNMCCTVVQMSQRVDALEASIQDIINGDAPTGSTPSIPPSPGVSVSTPLPKRTRSGPQ